MVRVRASKTREVQVRSEGEGARAVEVECQGVGMVLSRELAVLIAYEILRLAKSQSSDQT